MLHQIIDRFAHAKILVIGDVILDQFIWGAVTRISPEAPVPVVNVNKEELLLGGSANVVRNIISLGGTASLCGIIGNDAMGAELLALMQAAGASTDGLIKGLRPTTIKTRVVAQSQQVVRYDREQVGPPSQQTLERLLAYLEQHVADFDAVLVSDYAKGVICDPLMQRLHQLLATERQHGKNVPLIIDPKPVNANKFSGATVITPNNFEATKISGIEIHDEETLLHAARKIKEKLVCETVLITRGEAGMALLEADKEMVFIPTMAQEVYDVTGAGDTVVAALSLGLAAGCSMTEAAIIANHAAGIVVGKVGTASVSREELLAGLEKEEAR
jgi:rfaE bifunctional protein kinase chain/domain